MSASSGTAAAGCQYGAEADDELEHDLDHRIVPDRAGDEASVDVDTVRLEDVLRAARAIHDQLLQADRDALRRNRQAVHLRLRVFPGGGGERSLARLGDGQRA